MVTGLARPHRRVAVLTPTSRIDIVVPQHLPIADLLPTVLELARVSDADQVGWQLGKVGRAALDPEDSLESAGIRDGELLDLRPASAPTPEPVHDEITDFVAAVAAELAVLRPWSGRRFTVAAACVALAAALAWAWSERTDVAGVVSLLAGALVVLAVVAARVVHDLPVATVLGVAAVGFLAVAAAGRAPIGSTMWLTTGGAVTAAGVLMPIMLRAGLAVFSAMTVMGAMTAAAAALADGFGLSAADVAAGTVVFAASTLPMVPRAAALVAGLRRPGLTGDDTAVTGDHLEAAMASARRALAVVLGLDAGLATAASAAAVVLAVRSGPWSAVLAIVTSALLILRTRSVDVPVQAAALAVPAASGLLATMAIVVLRAPAAAHGVLLVGAVTLTAGALLAGRATAQRVPSPAAVRALRLVDGTLTLSVVPLAVAVLDGYSRVRHL